MGSFKPTALLNGFEMIRMAVQSALDGGLERVFVVVGNRAGELRTALEAIDDSWYPDYDSSRVPWQLVQSLSDGPAALVRSGDLLLPRIAFVENPDYANTDMLCSLKLGMAAAVAEGYQALFILPADAPAISPKVFGRLLGHAATSQAAVLYPSYNGSQGHPLLLGQGAFSAVLGFAGGGGLAAAVQPLPAEAVAVDDPAVLLDADDPDALCELQGFIQSNKGVSMAVAANLLNELAVLANIRAHCRATAAVVLRMARRLNRLGYCLDSELAASAAALHDICRLEERHAKAGEQLLGSRGYTALALVVGAHHGPLPDAPAAFTESNLVFIVDKLVKETGLVPLPERYAKSFADHPADGEVGARIRRDVAVCHDFIARYMALTGDYLFRVPCQIEPTS
jgi:CTP:molybdopterin cytidylyltransferase MocA